MIRIDRHLIYLASITALLIGEICFYTLGTLPIYFALTGLPTVFGLLVGVRRIHSKIRINHYLVWLVVVNLMFFINGFFRLRRGEFIWDLLTYRFFECFGLFFLFSVILEEDVYSIVKPFVIAGLFSAAYLFAVEGSELLLRGTRIGEALSGNVNTVGFNFALISIFMTWSYCIEKKRSKLILLLFFFFVMLITGSRKVIIVILMDLIMIFIYDRHKASRWLKAGIVLVVALVLVFNVDYFYQVIGIRIESMFETLIYGRTALLYDSSTDLRNGMIKEGFQIFKSAPILGGGWNYFYANTSYNFDYSHNNYIEMLCSFGIVGAIIWYSKHASLLSYCLKNLNHVDGLRKNMIILAMGLVINTILLDYASVSFSSQCVMYIPLLVAAIMVDKIKYSQN